MNKRFVAVAAATSLIPLGSTHFDQYDYRAEIVPAPHYPDAETYLYAHPAIDVTTQLYINMDKDPMNSQQMCEITRPFAADRLESSLESAKKSYYENLVSGINQSINPERIYSIDSATIREALVYLLQRGFSINGAAAITGAFMSESRLNPAVENGHGLAQWIGRRLRRVQPKITDTLTEQIQKAIDEMMTFYPDVYNDLVNPTRTIEQQNVAMHRYEGEGVRGNRRVYAATLAELMHSKNDVSLAAFSEKLSNIRGTIIRICFPN